MMPYVFVRPNELRYALWKDINWELAEWRYTARKTNTPHIVPLAPQVIDILIAQREVAGDSEFIFPSQLEIEKPMGACSMNLVLRRMGYSPEEMTIHGFRATARTMLDELLGDRYEYIEQQLADAVRDPNGRAYNRTEHLAERKKMMNRWANYLDKLKY